MTPITQAASASDAEPVIEMRRTFKAPRDKVFAAWTTADALAAWMGPKAVTARIEALDLKPGGAYRLVMVGDPATAGGDSRVASMTGRVTSGRLMTRGRLNSTATGTPSASASSATWSGPDGFKPRSSLLR